MQAILSFGAKDVRLVTVPDPIPQAGQVLIRVQASGICGSDKWLWRHPEPTTAISGHEVAGEIIALGEGVQRLKLGDRVAVNNVVGCGRCAACRRGAFVLCEEWDGSHDVNGGFAEWVAAPERNCLLLAEEIDSLTGAQIFDNFGTPFAAIERAAIAPGDDVLISGCGPIGLAAILMARLRGAFVIAADPLPARRAFALSLGADHALAPDEHLPQAVRDLTDGAGARAALECSGKSPAYPLVLRALRIGGTLISVGEGAQYDLHPSDTLIRRHLTIAGTWYSSMGQGAQIQQMIRQRLITPRVLISHTAPLAGFPALFQKVCEQPDDVIKALVIA
jgi:threonine dehydrogenase-like Zn-dependent dehydrogenase